MTGKSLKLKTKKLVTIIVVLIMLSISFSHTLTPQQARANTNEVGSVVNTGGFINFDDYNGNITIHPQTGNMSGFAWSNDLGWIDFSNNGSNGVIVNLVDGKLSGKALVVSTSEFLDFTANGSDVKIDMANGSMSGYVWSEDLGWIGFSGVSSRIAGAISEINSLIQVGFNMFTNIYFATFLIALVGLIGVYFRERSYVI